MVGELKKLLAVETGLEPGEQRLIFRGKDRENGEYLDTCGVKDRSKVILIEDPESKERRLIEMRRNAKIQAIHRLIDDVSAEVDRLAEQVSQNALYVVMEYKVLLISIINYKYNIKKTRCMNQYIARWPMGNNSGNKEGKGG